MRVALQKSPIPATQAFVVKQLKDRHFDPNWHFHPEYQLFVVLRGTGTRFIGDQVKAFREGDMVFTGPDLPHLWRSDAEYFEGREDLWVEGIVVYFQEDFLGKAFLEKEEAFRLKQLFLLARRGLEVTGSTAEEVKEMMQELLKVEGFEKVLHLLKILHVLASTPTYTVLSSAGYTNTLKEDDTERMNLVHAFVMRNFKTKISLEEVALMANMAPTSFCRYFKTHANKTFSDFVSEIRIGYACKLLIEKEVSVGQACYESGFQTLSNFNRQFKAFTKLTPREYKKEFAEAVLL